MGGWLAFLFSPMGRASRLDMWVKFALPACLLLVGAGVGDQFLELDLAAQLGPLADLPFSTAILAFLVWPSIAVAIKRAHDHGWSGWWVALLVVVQLGSVAAMLLPLLTSYRWAVVFEFIPLPVFFGAAVSLTASVYQFAYFYCMPGQDFTNRFGPDPRAPDPGLPDRDNVRIFD